MTEHFEGKGGPGEHRTVGAHRAWCLDCHEWCYPRDDAGCPCCERWEERADDAEKLVREVASCPITLDEPELDYVEVMIERSLWNDLQSVVRYRPEDSA